jgi:hypothetical protein
MVSERKKYIIKLFLKRCSVQNVMKAHLKISLELMENTYKVSDSALKELRKEYSLDRYIERIIPILDSQFSIDELQEAIRFYSSGVGRKMLDPKFLGEIDKEGLKMDSDIAQEFSIAHERS